MSKNEQSSVDYYITKLTEILGPEIIKQISRDDNERIARLEKQAKEMHKEEIEIIQITNLEANYIPHFQSAKGEFFTTKFNQLTYGGNK